MRNPHALVEITLIGVILSVALVYPIGIRDLRKQLEERIVKLSERIENKQQ